MDKHINLGGQLCSVALKVAVGQIDSMLRLPSNFLHEALVLILDAFHLEEASILENPILSCLP